MATTCFQTIPNPNTHLVPSLRSAHHSLLRATHSNSATHAISAASSGFSAARTLFPTTSLTPSFLSLSRPPLFSLTKAQLGTAIAEKQALLQDICLFQAERMLRGVLIWDVALMHAMAWGDLEAELEVRRELERRECGKPRSMAEDWAWVNEAEMEFDVWGEGSAGKKVRKAAPAPIEICGAPGAYMPGCRAVHVVSTSTPTEDKGQGNEDEACIWQELVEDMELHGEDAEELVQLLLLGEESRVEEPANPFLTDEERDWESLCGSLLLSDSEAEAADGELEDDERDAETEGSMVDVDLGDLFAVQPALRWMLQGDGRSEDAITLVDGELDEVLLGKYMYVDEDEAYEADSESVC